MGYGPQGCWMSNGVTVGNVNNVIPFPGQHGTPALAPSTPHASLNVARLARQRIAGIRDDKALKKPDKVRAMFNYIGAQEIQWGGQAIYAEQQAYHFDGLDRKLYTVDIKDADFRAFLAVRYGLLATEEYTRDVVSAMESFTVGQGKRREVRRFSFFDKKTKTLYISQYNGMAWKIDGTLVTIVPNGEGVVFADDDGGVPCQGVMVGANDVLFPTLINSMDPATGRGMNYVPLTAGGMTPDDQRCMFATWIFALAFNELLPTKPLFLVHGEKGAGKTSCIQLVQYALFGHSMPVQIGQRDEADFGVQLSRTVIALIDNTDTPVEWLKDALCAYTTGAGWRRRQLYTNTGQVTIKPQAFVALATKNPETFRRDDVADRCLIMKLARRDDQHFTHGISSLGDAIAADRPWLLGEYLYYLNEIVALMRAGTLTIPPAGHRMVDYANLIHQIGPVLGFTAEDITHMFLQLQDERKALALEDDVLTDVIDKWLDNTKNQGRQISLLDLFSELTTVAQDHKLRLFRSSKTLARRLKDTQTMSEHFKIRHIEAAGMSMYEIRRAVPATERLGDSSPEDAPARPRVPAPARRVAAPPRIPVKSTGSGAGWEDDLRRGLGLGKPKPDSE